MKATVTSEVAREKENEMMMQAGEVAKVYRTTDYNAFKFMKENRQVKGARYVKVKKSIEERGYIFNPLIVNEKMEIIDGQARFEVLRDKGMPVDFIMKEGLTAKDCIALNTTVTIWTTEDYIESYMNLGWIDYERLWKVCSRYKSSGLTVRDIVFAITGKIDINSKVIRDGLFVCSQEQAENAARVLEYLTPFMPIIKKSKKGNNSLMTGAVMFVFQMGMADNKKLFERVDKYLCSDLAQNYISMDGALKVLSDIYNYHSNEKVHWDIEYEKYQSGRYAWYQKRYGKGRVNVEGDAE